MKISLINHNSAYSAPSKLCDSNTVQVLWCRHWVCQIHGLSIPDRSCLCMVRGFILQPGIGKHRLVFKNNFNATLPRHFSGCNPYLCVSTDGPSSRRWLRVRMARRKRLIRFHRNCIDTFLTSIINLIFRNEHLCRAARNRGYKQLG